MARPKPRISRESNIEFIDDKSGARMVHYGTRFREVVLPRGSRVIYPNAPLDPLGNPKAAIRYALNHPEGADPFFAQLKPGMKLTIAMDDISLPLPPMKSPDLRELILTELLKQCAEYGVDDIHIIIAVCLHRHMTGPEIRKTVGSKIYNEYYPDRLYNHDAEDLDNIVELGETDHGERVRLNRRAAESDLLVYVNINLVPMDGGHKSVTVGLCDYLSVSAHHNTHTMHRCHSYMDPRPDKSRLAKICNRMGEIVDKELNVFHIETALNNRMYGGQLAYLGRPETTWSEFDRAKFQGSCALLERLPESARRSFFEKIPSHYELTAIHAGATEPTHDKILDACFKQYAVPVKGQCDVLVSGIPFISPYNVNSILNPLLIQVMALGYLFNMYRGSPLIKKDGVMILFHPCHESFNRTHHPSYVEFYHRILSIGTNSYDIHQYEREFAENPDYIHMYRHGNAYHGVHPFYMWYWGDAGRAWVGKVIVVEPENLRVPKQLGWESAPDFNTAMDMARSFLGKPHPEVTMSHAPPIMIADVEA
ncbi:MAG: transcriptional regulator [Myxococcales bacterium]|nr:transcriptional regulator [Myxococcales bacterium]